jgi:hypothetical protein
MRRLLAHASRVRPTCFDPPAVAAEDTLDAADREILRNLLRRSRLLPPAERRPGSSYRPQRWQVRWAQALTLVAVCEALVIPLRIAFSHGAARVGAAAGFVAFGWAVDALYWLDMGMAFRTMHVTADNELVTDKHAIASHYARGRLPLDLLASCPLELAALGAPGGLAGVTAAACRLNRLIRLRRLATVHASQLVRLSRPRRLAVFWALWLVFIHWCACIWWALGNARFNSTDARRRPWLERVPPGGTRLSPASSLSAAYWSSVYWSLTTLVKQVPWIAPATRAELAFTMAVFTLGAFTYVVLVGEVTAIVQSSLTAWKRKSERMAVMRTYCAQRGVARRLQRTVFAWVAADQEHAQRTAGTAHLDVLPRPMRAEMLLLIHAPVVASVRAALTPTGLGELMARLRPMACLRSQVLIEEGDACAHLYFLQRGALRVSTSGTTAAAAEPGAAAAARPSATRASGAGMRKLLGDAAISAACAREAAAASSTGGRASGRMRSFQQDPSKAFTSFRMLEREGALVGLPSPAAPPRRSPFAVEAQRLAHLQYVSRAELLGACAHMAVADAEALTAAIERAHHAHLQSLKLVGFVGDRTRDRATDGTCDRSSKGGGEGSERNKAEEHISHLLMPSLNAMRLATSCLPDLLSKVGRVAARANTAPSTSTAIVEAPAPSDEALYDETAADTVDTVGGAPLSSQQDTGSLPASDAASHECAALLIPQQASAGNIFHASSSTDLPVNSCSTCSHATHCTEDCSPTHAVDSATRIVASDAFICEGVAADDSSSPLTQPRATSLAGSSQTRSMGHSPLQHALNLPRVREALIRHSLQVPMRIAPTLAVPTDGTVRDASPSSFSYPIESTPATPSPHRPAPSRPAPTRCACGAARDRQIIKL